MGAPNELSFLPDDYLERKARRRTNVICAVLFFIVISAIGGAFTVTERSMQETNQQYSIVQAQYTDAAKRIEQVQQMQEKQRTMAHQAELTASLLEKVPRSKMLAEITNDIPAGVSLLDFRMESSLKSGAPAAPKTAFEMRRAELQPQSTTVAGIPVAQVRTYDVSMKLSGIASTDIQVASFIAKLNAAGMFRDVNLVVTEEYKNPAVDSKLRKFEIEMKLNPNYTVDLAGAPGTNPTRTAAVSLEAK